LIETKRLIIRYHHPEDWKDLFEYLSLPETYVFEPGNPISIEEVKIISIERSKGKSFFPVILKDQNKMIGHLYFQQIEPIEFMTWELGYIFNPKYHNQGYATEACKGIIKFGFTEYHAHKIVAFCNPKNIPSWKVLEKIGMRKEGHFKEKAFFRRDKDNNPIWHDCYAYGLLAEEK